MSQEAFFAKQEDRFSSLGNLMKHLIKLQGTHQQTILEGIGQHQKRVLLPPENTHLKVPSWQDYLNYLTDLNQRTLLFWDVLRQRGDNLLAYEQAGFPIQLKFRYETVLDGKTLPNPVNYSLLHILPEAGQSTDETLPPVVIIDPRGGHGAGISGFKEESTVGESLRVGHPTYFIGFSHAPESGQTLETIGLALAHFIEWVSAAHPEGGKPVIIGNCQAGWAVMGLAAIHPELPGLIIINGAPLSYWAGANGRNPMRYSGGLLGGAWLTRLGSDIGNGRFDGTWLVSNFELLNPANTFWNKYYHLFTQVDSEAPRFLEFERWWSSPILFNSEEIEAIVDDLFIGNQLTRAQCKCSYTDLRDIEAPVVVFCSNGDDITPPQQALNWIADLYPDDLSLQAAGRVIIYLEHQSIGHLGLFVSSRVAQREHRQMISAIDAINALPPGLYELVIDEHSDGAQPYTLHFEPRKILDILNQEDTNNLDDEREFALVDRVSEINSSLYDWSVRPWLHQLINEPTANLVRQTHPFRQERLLWSSLNPALWWLPGTAQQVRETRRPVSPANPLLAWQNLFAKTVEDNLNTWRDVRDSTHEWLFHAFYGSFSTFSEVKKPNSEPNAAHLVAKDKNQTLIKNLRAELSKGGMLEASVRILLLLAHTASRLDKDLLQHVLANFREEIQNNASVLSAPLLKEIARIQGLLVFAYPQESLKTLPMLLPTVEARQQTMEKTLARIQVNWKTSAEPFGSLWRELYQELGLPLPEFAQAPVTPPEQILLAEPTPVPVSSEPEEQILALAAPEITEAPTVDSPEVPHQVDSPAVDAAASIKSLELEAKTPASALEAGPDKKAPAPAVQRKTVTRGRHSSKAPHRNTTASNRSTTTANTPTPPTPSESTPDTDQTSD